jgi:hypothetical protein
MQESKRLAQTHPWSNKGEIPNDREEVRIGQVECTGKVEGREIRKMVSLKGYNLKGGYGILSDGRVSIGELLLPQRRIS